MVPEALRIQVGEEEIPGGRKGGARVLRMRRMSESVEKKGGHLRARRQDEEEKKNTSMIRGQEQSEKVLVR